MSVPADAPIVSVRDLVKDHRALRPLRVRELDVRGGDVVSIDGIDLATAEVFVHLVTGGALPDTGEVRLFGQDTRTIADGEAWLKSLDGLGIVSARAVLVEAFTPLQNIAMPLTLEVDPINPRVLPTAGALAREAGLDAAHVDVPVGALDPLAAMRTHLGRALALDPALLIVEHPSASLPRGSVEAYAADVARAAAARGAALIALTSDELFAKALGGRRLKLDAASGDLRPVGAFNRIRHLLGGS